MHTALISKHILKTPPVFLLAFVLLVSTCLADPSHKNPEQMFGVYGGEASQKLLALAEGYYEEATKAILKFEEAAQHNRLQRIKPQAIGDADLALRMLSRAAGQLTILGEPTAVDLQSRAGHWRLRHSKILGVASGLPPAVPYLVKIRGRIKNTFKSRMKELEAIRKLIEKEKYPTAEIRLYNTLDELYRITRYIPSSGELQAIFSPYTQVDAAISSHMDRVRRRAAFKLHVERRAAEQPPFSATLEAARAALASIANTGQYTVEGAILSGPETVAFLGEQWKAAQVAMLRARALDWVAPSVNEISDDPANAVTGLAGLEAMEQNKSKLDQPFFKFVKQFQAALGEIIAADANRIQPADAERLYLEYLDVLAPLCARSNAALTQAVEPALQQFLAKSDAFASRVKHYSSATTELLRWRERVAASRAQAQVSQYAPIINRFHDATQSTKEFRSLIYVDRTNLNAPQLLGPAPQIVVQAWQNSMGQPTSVSDVVAVLPRKLAVSRFQNRVYTRVANANAPPQESAALRADLLVNETARPLTLEGAVALFTVEQGDFEQVGGEIVGLQLEMLVTRFATLKPAAWAITVLGAPPLERNTSYLINHVIGRFDIKPQWLRHRYFFARVADHESSPIEGGSQ